MPAALGSNAATASGAARVVWYSVNVELAGFAKLGTSWKKRSPLTGSPNACAVKYAKRFGVPGGGAAKPS
jgi:hypothetical protein